MAGRWGVDGTGWVRVCRAARGGGPITMRYRGTAEQRVMAALCGLAWAGAIVLAIRQG